MIDMTKIGGQYQPLAPYRVISGGNAAPARADENSRQRIEQIKEMLRTAGFVQSGPGGNWFHIAGKRQARICVDVPTDELRPKGEIFEGTVGIELWHEPRPEAFMALA
jgi:hypothetical protein